MKKIFTTIVAVLFCIEFSYADNAADSVKNTLLPDTLHARSLNQGIISDPLQMMNGKFTGAEVIKAGSDPSVPSLLMVRGMTNNINSLKTLYIIDGVVGADIFMIPPQEIESVKILKDLAETSFYGNEGTNGVVIVTTKKGTKKKKIGVDFTTEISLGKATSFPDIFSADEMRAAAARHPEIEFTDGGASTDYIKEVTRSAVSQSYQLGIGGTLKNTGYRVSFDHIAQPGTIKNTDRSVTGGKLILTQSAFKNRIRIEGMVSYFHSANNFKTLQSAVDKNPLFQMLTNNPTDPVYDANGDYYRANRNFNNKNAVEVINSIKEAEKRKFLNAAINGTWDIWKGFGLMISGSYWSDKRNSSYSSADDLFGYNPAFSRNEGDTSERYNLLSGITWKRDMKRHHFDAFAGFYYRNSSVIRIKSEKEAILENQKTTYDDYGFRGRISYSFDNRYDLDLVINQEHNSQNAKFFNNNLQGTWGQSVFYPGIVASWNIDHEKFMKNIKPISTLNLKFSYGKAGLGPEPGFLQYYENIPATYENQITSEYTASLEAGTWHNRILLHAEYYNRFTPNAYGYKSLQIPPSAHSLTIVNGMEVANEGIEIDLSAHLIKKTGFNWVSRVSFSMNNNEIIKSEASANKSGYIPEYGYRFFSILTADEGHPLLAFIMPEFSGVYTPEGQPVYLSRGGTYTTNPDSANKIIADKVFPKYFITWSNQFNIMKSLDISFMLRYAGGFSTFNGTEMVLSDRYSFLYMNTTEEAEANYNSGIYSEPLVSAHLEDASYLRLENLCIGYTVRPHVNSWQGSLRIYLAVNNLFTITNYSGMDPAFNGQSMGIDYFNTYPRSRTYTIGLSLGI